MVITCSHDGIIWQMKENGNFQPESVAGNDINEKRMMPYRDYKMYNGERNSSFLVII